MSNVVKLLVVTVLLLVSIGTVLAADDFNAPVIQSKSPLIDVNSNPVTVSVTTDESSTCKYSTSDTTYSSMTNSFGSSLTTSHSVSLVLSEASYTYYVRCSDASGNAMSHSEVISFDFDTKVPSVTSTNDLETHVDNFVLELTTDESAICRIGSDENDKYNNMTLFTSTGIENLFGQLKHTHLVEDLILGHNTFYVKCSDEAGNVMSIPYVLSINNLGSLAATITIDGNIVTEGIHTITLKTNVPLSEKPTLTYSFDNSNFNSLEVNGKDTEWFAFLEIGDGVGDKTGKFRFSGKDIYGLESTYIESGATFEVDTEVPVKIETISASRDIRGKVTLVWNDEGVEDIKFYEVYKSQNSTITELDLEKKVFDPDYFDPDTLPEETYYYAIRPVDDADNEGPFSDVIVMEPFEGAVLTSTASGSIAGSTTATTPTTTTTEAAAESQVATETTTQASTSSGDVEANYAEINELVNTISEDRKDIDTLKQDFTEDLPFDVIEKLQIFKHLTDAKNELRGMKEDLEKLDPASLSTVDFKVKMKKYTESRNALVGSLPKEVKVLAETEQKYSLQDDDLDTVASELEVSHGFDKKTKKAVEKATDGLEVTNKFVSVSVTYDNQTTKNKLIVAKDFKLVGHDKVAQFYVIDSIPKDVLTSITDKVGHNLKEFEVLKDDPIIMYRLSFNREQATAEYVIDDVGTSIPEKGFATMLNPTKLVSTGEEADSSSSVELKGSSESGSGLAGLFTGFAIKSPTSLTKNMDMFDILIYVLIFMLVMLIVVNNFVVKKGKLSQGLTNMSTKKNNNRKHKHKHAKHAAGKQLAQKKKFHHHVKEKFKSTMNKLGEMKSKLPSVSAVMAAPKNKIADMQAPRSKMPLSAVPFTKSLPERKIEDYEDDEYELEQSPFDNELFNLLEYESQIYAHKNYEKSGIKPLHNIQLLTILDEAHTNIDGLQFEKANNIYNLMLSTHAKNIAKLNQQDNHHFKQSMNQLCLKLNLYTNLWYAHVVAKKKDTRSLKRYLNKLASDFNKLTKKLDNTEYNSKLLKYASYYHAKYADLLVELER